MTTGKWRDIKQTWKCAFTEKIHSGSGYAFQTNLQSTVKCYPMNNEGSEAGLQKQLLKADVLAVAQVGWDKQKVYYQEGEKIWAEIPR